jgi:hypothetical protein
LAGLVAWLGAAGGVAWRWVTLPDWRPKDLPPPRRLASASKLKAPTRNTAKQGQQARKKVMVLHPR